MGKIRKIIYHHGAYFLDEASGVRQVPFLNWTHTSRPCANSAIYANNWRKHTRVALANYKVLLSGDGSSAYDFKNSKKSYLFFCWYLKATLNLSSRSIRWFLSNKNLYQTPLDGARFVVLENTQVCHTSISCTKLKPLEQVGTQTDSLAWITRTSDTFLSDNYHVWKQSYVRFLPGYLRRLYNYYLSPSTFCNRTSFPQQHHSHQPSRQHPYLAFGGIFYCCDNCRCLSPIRLFISSRSYYRNRTATTSACCSLFIFAALIDLIFTAAIDYDAIVSPSWSLWSLLCTITSATSAYPLLLRCFCFCRRRLHRFAISAIATTADTFIGFRQRHDRNVSAVVFIPTTTPLILLPSRSRLR